MIYKNILVILLLAFIFRTSVVFWGYHGDLNNNISWGTLAYERGLNGFYGSSDARDWPYSAPNQPPLTLLLFTGLRALWIGVNNSILSLNTHIPLFPSKLVWFWESKGMILLVKLPSIVADLLIGCIIYDFTKRILKNKKKALYLFCLWLFNPLVWYNSSIWGQTDSIVNLLGLIAVISLLDKKIIKSVFFLTLSLLFKGSLTIFLPIFFVIALKQGHSVKKLFLSAIYALVLVLVSSVWFHPYLDLPIWLINLYKDRIMPGEIGYLTANAFNMWYLVSPDKTSDYMTIFGLSARTIGFIIFGGLYTAILLKIRKYSGNYMVLFSLSLVALASFLFITRMHERYLYPFFPYATFVLAILPQITVGFVLLSVIHLFNLYNLFWVPSFPALEAIMKNSNYPIAFSIITLAVFFNFLYIFLRQKSPA